MSRPVDTIHSESTISGALHRMRQLHHGCLVVVDGHKLVGIVTRRDLDKAIQHRLGERRVTFCMSARVVAVAPQTPLPLLLKTMSEERVGHLPVVSGRKVVGMVARGDLLRILAPRGDEKAPIRSILPVATMLKERLPVEIVDLLRKMGEVAKMEGMEAYAVGGFVRDLLLGVENLDIDVVVEGNGIAYARAFAHRFGGKVKPHTRFGTAILIARGGKKIDVATARLEEYERPGALPQVKSSGIAHDLYRRDFTINSLAIHLNPERFGRLLDLFGGRRDIELRIIRVLHNLSFVEDPTRLLRAVRFEQRHRMAMDGRTEHLLREVAAADMLWEVSGQRIREELILMLKEESPIRAIKRLDQLRLLSAIHPQLAVDERNSRALDNTPQAIRWFHRVCPEVPVDEWRVYLLGLSLPLSKGAVAGISDRLHLSRRSSKLLLEVRERERSFQQLCEGLTMTESCLYRTAEGVSPEVMILWVARAEGLKERLCHYLTDLSQTQLEITGDDLVGLGISPGPIYSKILNATLNAKLDGHIAGRDEELRLARDLAKSIAESSSEG